MKHLVNGIEVACVRRSTDDTRSRRARGWLGFTLALGVSVLSSPASFAESDPSVPGGLPQQELATDEEIEAANALRIRQIKNLLTTWGTELELWKYGEDGHYINLTAHSNFMAAMYSPDAQLLPTVSPGAWKTPGGYNANCADHTIANYFGCKFLTKKPMLVDVNDEFVTFSPDLMMAMNQGRYTFEVEFVNRNGVKKRLNVAARYTFVYRKGARADWSDAKIIMHHSSGEPGLFPFPGDVNVDGFVDFRDVTMLLTHWRPS